MPIVMIGTEDYDDCLRKRLALEVSFLRKDGIIINIDEVKQGRSIIFKCKYETGQNNDFKDISLIFKEAIANVLSDIIIDYMEEEILFKILRDNYNSFDSKEEEDILKLAINRLNFMIDKDDGAIVSQIQRKNRILNKICDYLIFNDEIILEGFVKFRLKDYLTELRLAVDIAVDDFVIEQEYEEFVGLLKCFVDKQEVKNKLVNVIKIDDKKFKLLNENGIVVESTYLDEYMMGMIDSELNYEDLLISALITVAAEKIILHFKEPFSLVKTLKGIFGDKISFCSGCEYCNKYNSNHLE